MTIFKGACLLSGNLPNANLPNLTLIKNVGSANLRCGIIKQQTIWEGAHLAYCVFVYVYGIYIYIHVAEKDPNRNRKC